MKSYIIVKKKKTKQKHLSSFNKGNSVFFGNQRPDEDNMKHKKLL